MTISGKLVKTIKQIAPTEGFRVNSIYWDGRDDFGSNVGKGVYIYRCIIRTPDGRLAEKIEKLAILK
jgi:flagellar hook assembly protein FlgD